MEEHEKPRLSRLMTIVTQLQSKSLITAKQLADKHGVSVRTIYRDIRTLEQSGIPIVMEEGKGYSLLDEFSLPPISFTEEEANALITAEHILAKVKDQSLSDNYSKAVTKIKSVLKTSQVGKADLLEDRIFYRQSHEDEKSSHYLMKIQKALTSFQLLKITYSSKSFEETVREIEPFALYSTQGNWLLVAFCRLRRDFRSFRIDQIQELTVQNVTFSPHDMTMDQYFKLYIQKKRNNP